MAELYTPSSVSTGINGNAEFLLNLDSQQRYNNVFNDFKAPIEYKIPEFSATYDYNGLALPQILSSTVNAGTLSGGLLSDDVATRDLAWANYDKNFEKDAVNRGVGQALEIKAEDWQNKYKNDTFGYNPNLSQGENEAYYYQNQYQNKSTAGKFASNIGKFTARTLGSAVLKLGQGLGYMGGMITGGYENFIDGVTGEDKHTFMAAVADNALARFLEVAENDMKDSGMLSIYKPDDWDKKGFFSKMGNGAFWSDEFADGISFLVSAAVPGAVLGKLGSGVSLLGKSVNAVNKVRNVAQRFLGLETLGDAASVIYNTVSESAFEAAGVFKTMKANLISARDKGENTLSDEEIEKRAGESAARDFKLNLGILSVSTLFENKFVFKPLAKRLAGMKTPLAEDGVLKGANNIALDGAAKASMKESSKNIFGKMAGVLSDGSFNRYSRLSFYGSRAVSGIAMEGFWEENAQLAAERISTNAKYHDDDGNEIGTEDTFLSQLKKQTVAVSPFGDGDPEAATSIGLGGLIGVLGGGVMAKAIGGTSEVVDPITGARNMQFKFGKGERKSRIDAIAKQVDKYNEARMNFLSTHDVYKKDEQGKIQFDDVTNEPLIDNEKVAAKLESLTAYGFSQIRAEDIENPLFREKLQKDLFAEYMAAAVRGGLDARVIEKLQQLPAKTVDQIAEMGFDTTSIKMDVPALVSKAKKLVKSYHDIFSESTDPQKGITYNEYEAKEELRKFHAYNATARSDSSKEALQEYEKIILAQQAAVRPGVGAAKPYDALVQRHNDLRAEEISLTQAKNEFKTFEYSLLNPEIDQRLADVAAEKATVRKSIDDMGGDIANLRDFQGLLVDDRFVKFVPDKMRNELDIEAFSSFFEPNSKKAQMSADSMLNMTLANKLRDRKKGGDVFDEYRQYLAKRRETDIEADTERKEANEAAENIEKELVVVETEESPLGKAPEETKTTTTEEEELLAASRAGNEATSGETKAEAVPEATIVTPEETFSATEVAEDASKRTDEESRAILDKAETTSKEDIDNDFLNNIC